MRPPAQEGLLRERVGLGLAVVAVLAYAVVALDGTSLWLDEAYTLGAVNRLGDSLRGTHGTMGLYYCIMWVWGLVSTATWWLRLPSVIFAVASLVVLRPIARRIGGSDLVAVALPVAALSPMFLWKATEARSYSLETLIVAGCWYLLFWAADADSDRSATRRYLLMTPLAIAGVFGHGLFIVQLVPIGLLAFLAPRPWIATRSLAPAAVATGSLTLYLRGSGGRNIGTTLIGGTSDAIRVTIDMLLGSAPLTRTLLVVLLVVGVATAVRTALRSTNRLDRLLVLAPASWALVPCLTLGLLRNVAPVFNPRYLAPVTLGIGLTVGQALLAARGQTGDQPHTKEHPPVVLWVAAAAILGVLGFGAASSMPYLDQDWREAADTVSAGLEPDDAIIFANLSGSEPVQHRPPFEAAWRETPHIADPTVISHDRPLGEVRRFDEPRSVDDTVAVAGGHGNVWIVELQEDGSNRIAMFADRLQERWNLVVLQSWQFDGGIAVTRLGAER